MSVLNITLIFFFLRLVKMWISCGDPGKLSNPPMHQTVCLINLPSHPFPVPSALLYPEQSTVARGPPHARLTGWITRVVPSTVILRSTSALHFLSQLGHCSLGQMPPLKSESSCFRTPFPSVRILYFCGFRVSYIDI